MATYVYDAVNDKLNLVAGGTLYAASPVGSIIAFAGKETNLPEGYLAFNGQTVKRGDYPDLWAFAVANEQVGVDKFFSQGDGATTFTLADLRETSLKGYGETSRSVGAHVKSGGLAVGEFIDDQLQNHTHKIPNNNLGNGSIGGSNTSGVTNVYNAIETYEVHNARTGTTTEVKAVGVVWAVKAKMTGLPIDLKQQVENYIDENAKSPISANNKLVTESDLHRIEHTTFVASLSYSYTLPNDCHAFSLTVMSSNTGNTSIISGSVTDNYVRSSNNAWSVTMDSTNRIITVSQTSNINTLYLFGTYM